MFWIDWQVTLIALVVLPLVAPAIARSARSCAGPRMSTQEQTALMASMVSESLGRRAHRQDLRAGGLPQGSRPRRPSTRSAA